MNLRVVATVLTLAACFEASAQEITVPPKPPAIANLTGYQTAAVCLATAKRAAIAVAPNSSQDGVNALATMATVRWSWEQIKRSETPGSDAIPASVANQTETQELVMLKYCSAVGMRYYVALPESVREANRDSIVAIMREFGREGSNDTALRTKTTAFSSKVIERCGNPTLNQTQAVRVSQAAEQEFAEELRKWSWRTDACGAYLRANYKGEAMAAKSSEAMKKLGDAKASAPAFYDQCVEWRTYTLDIQAHCHD